MKELNVALSRYVGDVEQFPSAASWCDQLSEYLDDSGEATARGTFACPAAKNQEGSYAFNIALSGMKSRDLPMPEEGSRVHVVAIFESDAGWNAAGGPESLPDRPRHFGGDNYVFADSSASWVPRKRNPDGSYAKAPAADWVRWEVEAREPEE